MITSGIETTNNITYKIKDQEPRLIITHGNEYSEEYLTTGVLCKDLEQKFRLFLTKNYGWDDWSGAGVFVIKDGTPSSEYLSIT